MNYSTPPTWFIGLMFLAVMIWAYHKASGGKEK